MIGNVEIEILFFQTVLDALDKTTQEVAESCSHLMPIQDKAICSQIEIRHSGPRVLMTKVWPSRALPNISSISTHGNFLDLHFWEEVINPKN